MLPERTDIDQPRKPEGHSKLVSSTANERVGPRRGPCARLGQGSCTGEHPGCVMCTGTEMLNYSGKDPGVIAGYESFQRDIDLSEPVPRAARRISCANVSACIRTAKGEEIIVNQTSIGREGAGFITSAEIGIHSEILIATHYVAGSQNIFQKARITSIRRDPAAFPHIEYEVEFE